MGEGCAVVRDRLRQWERNGQRDCSWSVRKVKWPEPTRSAYNRGRKEN